MFKKLKLNEVILIGVLFSVVFLLFGISQNFMNKFFSNNLNDILCVWFIITSMVSQRLCNLTIIKGKIKCCKHESRHLIPIQNLENVDSFIIHAFACNYKGIIPIAKHKEMLLNPTKMSLLDLFKVSTHLIIISSSLMLDGFILLTNIENISVESVVSYLLMKLLIHIILIIVSGLGDIFMYISVIKKEKQGYTKVSSDWIDETLSKDINVNCIYQKDIKNGITSNDLDFYFVK